MLSQRRSTATLTNGYAFAEIRRKLVRVGTQSQQQLQAQQRQLAARHRCPRYAPRTCFERDRPLVPSAMLSSHNPYCASAAGADSAALQIKGGGGRPFCGRPAAYCLRSLRAPSSPTSTVDLWCALDPFPPPCIHPSDATACSTDPAWFALIAHRYGRRRADSDSSRRWHSDRRCRALWRGFGAVQNDRNRFFVRSDGALAPARMACSCTHPA
jgi:hypothetical protein